MKTKITSDGQWKIIEGDFLWIPLGCGQWKSNSPRAYAIIDLDMRELIAPHKWSLSDQGYAFRGYRRSGVLVRDRMHRIIMNTPDDMEVDHVNGNKLDNRKCNLRNCSHADNLRNSRKTKRVSATSKFKGVFFDKPREKWCARIYSNGKTTYLGRFHDELHAAQAYNLAAFKINGEFAHLNKL